MNYVTNFNGTVRHIRAHVDGVSFTLVSNKNYVLSTKFANKNKIVNNTHDKKKLSPLFVIILFLFFFIVSLYVTFDVRIS